MQKLLKKNPSSLKGVASVEVAAKLYRNLLKWFNKVCKIQGIYTDCK